MIIFDNNWAYLAGFLDGDGSIYVRVKPNKTYRFGFQIAPTVAFFQSEKEEKKIQKFQKNYGLGHLRKRNDGIVEWVIEDEKGIRLLLNKTNPFLKLKKKQAKLMIKILDNKSRIKTKKDFISLVKEYRFF
ncbi:MAG TPA: LAGLIDADG family homing endonuclease [Candidatus Pacearchaeota archaeon]|nr:LAGLIDADG family homing endonuclease [Candidatus Pacearchaeota archaeon]HPO75263.1 LAGLIDADG family homing endonuclease [Candidatus Pacearchaeota archaeon]